MSTQTVTYDDRDTSVLSYSGSWTLSGTWSDAAGDSGTLSSTNDQNAYVSFTFPAAAVSFTYYGMLRSRGGQYGVCIDCDPTSSSASFSSVDGFDASDKGNSPPVVLYSTTFAQPGVHVITMRNEADPRGTPAGNSQLTLDRIVLQLAVQGTTTTTHISLNPLPVSSTTPSTTSTTSSSTTSATSGTSSSATNTSSGTPPSSSGSSSTASVANANGTPAAVSNPSLSASSPATTSGGILGAATAPAGTSNPSSPPSHTGSIVGAVLGSLACIVCILLLVFWLRQRRRNSPTVALRPKSPAPRRPSPPETHVQPFVVDAPSSPSDVVQEPATPPVSALVSETEKLSALPSATARSGWGSIEKRHSHHRGHTTALSQSGSSSAWPSSASSVRERDAGPLSAYAEEDLPPPEYSQLYST